MEDIEILILDIVQSDEIRTTNQIIYPCTHFMTAEKNSSGI